MIPDVLQIEWKDNRRSPYETLRIKTVMGTYLKREPAICSQNPYKIPFLKSIYPTYFTSTLLFSMICLEIPFSKNSYHTETS